jgi:hypothetical protein
MDFTPFKTVSSQLGEYCNLVNQELISPNKIKLEKLIEAVESDPIASACVNLKSSRAIQLMNTPYVNKNNKDIEEFVRSNFNTMEDNIASFVGSMASAMPIGFSLAEIVFQKRPRQIRLRRFHVLNPTKSTFKVSYGRLTEVKYNDSGITKHIPLWKTIHVANGLTTSFGAKSVYGIPEVSKAYALIRLKQLILSNMALTSRRLATGIIVGQTDSNETTVLLDPKTGKPLKDPVTGEDRKVKTSFSLLQSLKAIENFGVLVTDKNNVVSSLNINGGEQFWNLALNLIDTQLLRCFQVPDTVFSAPTNPFGNGLISSNQLGILDSSIMNFVIRLKEALLEKVVKPLIYLNFGKQQDGYLGDWDVYDEIQEGKAQQSFTNLLQAMSMGVLSNQDYDALNSLREKLKLPKVNVETVAQQKELEATLQGFQQKAAQTAAQPSVEEQEQMMMDQQQSQPYPG